MTASDDLQKELAALQELLAEADELFGPIGDNLNKLNASETALRNAFESKMAIIRQKKLELHAEQNKIQQKKNEYKSKMDTIDWKIKAAEAEEAKRQQELALEESNKVLTERMDTLTIGAPWREWAKEHQIVAGKKIAMDRYVILADSMGLGKTLSSIIGVEMAERFTKDATPELPILGEEKEVVTQGYYVHKLTGQKTNWTPSQNLIDNFDYVPAEKTTKVVNGITRPVGRKVLYLCPAPLIKNVMDEWRMWAPHRNAAFIGGMTKAERNFLFEYGLKGLADYVIVCNYEAWRKDWSLVEKLIAQNFDTVIIDEAHNAKEMKTNIYKGIEAIILNDNRPEYVIPMTGTPVLNKAEEMYTMLHMVNPERFYNLNTFLFDFCEQNENGRWIFRPGGMERLAKQIGANYMRRTKKDAGVVLPEKTVIEHLLELDTETYPEQARARKQMRDFATIVLDESKGTAISAAAKIAVLTRLRQIETWPAGIVIRDKLTQEIKFELDVYESQKVDYIISPTGEDGLIPEVIEDERIVLFSQFKAPLYEIKNRIERAGYRAVILDGSTPADVKERIRSDFDRRHTPDRSKAEWDVVLCNYRVGGVGLNFTAATNLIILDEEWNPGKRDQAYDRLHRIGQEEAITINLVRNKNTVDDWLAGIMKEKEDMVDGFNSGMDALNIKDALDSGLI